MCVLFRSRVCREILFCYTVLAFCHFNGNSRKIISQSATLSRTTLLLRDATVADANGLTANRYGDSEASYSHEGCDYGVARRRCWLASQHDQPFPLPMYVGEHFEIALNTPVWIYKCQADAILLSSDHSPAIESAK
ncbi:hypothetical protein EAI_12150 [Harpegnathos saltator]|uniref:Uncharacterized protein n=1 Tax=Harpegnathos saltator TaxID=610380 RepID=E2BZ91_HARSA|nr:hypothetical protein EAI_12150 [Harpegnathos saltator]